MPTAKGAARLDLHYTPHPEYHGRLGQHLRQVKSYHNARQLFIAPAPTLSQLRINALIDGKDVIMPGPGLKEGFYLLKPFTIPFPKLSFAVTYKGVSQFGRRLAASDLDALAIDLLITDALAVDEYGTRLGDGLGFFDLSCAILAEHQALEVSHSNYAALDDETLLMPGPLPFDDWDVKMDGVILPTGVRDIANAGKNSCFIHWDQLPERRIKKIKPLWELRPEPTN